MRVLVCGGRKYNNSIKIEEVLSQYKIDCLIEGGAWGADYHAAQYAHKYGIWNEKYPAEWARYGKSAGMIRNRQMLTEGKPELVIAFPGGQGTANMVQCAIDAGVTVRVIEDN
jgi:YspA, cpYpsA-related SLOG family